MKFRSRKYDGCPYLRKGFLLRGSLLITLGLRFATLRDSTTWLWHRDDCVKSAYGAYAHTRVKASIPTVNLSHNYLLQIAGDRDPCIQDASGPLQECLDCKKMVPLLQFPTHRQSCRLVVIINFQAYSVALLVQRLQRATPATVWNN